MNNWTKIGLLILLTAPCFGLAYPDALEEVMITSAGLMAIGGFVACRDLFKKTS